MSYYTHIGAQPKCHCRGINKQWLGVTAEYHNQTLGSQEILQKKGSKDTMRS